MTSVYEDRWFRKLLSLVGSPVKVVTANGRELLGTVRSASFDCFLLNSPQGVQVVPYADILSLE